MKLTEIIKQLSLYLEKRGEAEVEQVLLTEDDKVKLLVYLRGPSKPGEWGGGGAV